MLVPSLSVKCYTAPNMMMTFGVVISLLTKITKQKNKKINKNKEQFGKTLYGFWNWWKRRGFFWWAVWQESAEACASLWSAQRMNYVCEFTLLGIGEWIAFNPKYNPKHFLYKYKFYLRSFGECEEFGWPLENKSRVGEREKNVESRCARRRLLKRGIFALALPLPTQQQHVLTTCSF